MIADDPAIFRIDGLTVDAKGTVYACVIVQSTIVRIGEGGIETLATAADGLNNASSIAFGQGLASQKPVRRELLGLLPRSHPVAVPATVGVPERTNRRDPARRAEEGWVPRAGPSPCASLTGASTSLRGFVR